MNIFKCQNGKLKNLKGNRFQNSKLVVKTKKLIVI